TAAAVLQEGHTSKAGLSLTTLLASATLAILALAATLAILALAATLAILALAIAVGLLRIGQLTLLLWIALLAFLAALAIAPTLVVALDEATHGLDHAEVMVGVLPVGLRHDAVARGGRFAGQRLILIEHLVSVAAHPD